MKENILVCSQSNKDIDYKEALSFYQWKHVRYEVEFDEEGIFVLDYNSLDETLSCANIIREYNEYAPLILVTEPQNNWDHYKLISGINGLGRIEFASFYDAANFHLVQHVESILQPQTTGQTSEMAIAIPVFNEVNRMEYVESFLRKIQGLIVKGSYSLSCYFIDDGSSDDTVDRLIESINTNMYEQDTILWKQPLNIRRLVVNTRKAGTYLDAFTGIDADYVITADADDSFNMEDIVKMIHMAKLGYYDMIIATKDQSQGTRPLPRILLSAVKRRLTSVFLPKGVTDSQTGLKVFNRRSVLTMLPYLNVEYELALDLEMLFLAKKMYLRVKEIPVTIIDREGSHINIVSDTYRFLKSMLQMAIFQEYRKLV